MLLRSESWQVFEVQKRDFRNECWEMGLGNRKLSRELLLHLLTVRYCFAPHRLYYITVYIVKASTVDYVIYSMLQLQVIITVLGRLYATILCGTVPNDCSEAHQKCYVVVLLYFLNSEHNRLTDLCAKFSEEVMVIPWISASVLRLYSCAEMVLRIYQLDFSLERLNNFTITILFLIV